MLAVRVERERPLHAGGGRWVAVGDALANLLAGEVHYVGTLIFTATEGDTLEQRWAETKAGTVLWAATGFRSSSARLRAWRRPAIVFIAVFSAVVTPSSDPYTMMAMMIPMYLFYEAAIIVIRLLRK